MYNLALAHRACNLKRGSKRIPQEAKVCIPAPNAIVCHTCAAELPDSDALLFHRLAEHGELSLKWAIPA